MTIKEIAKGKGTIYKIHPQNIQEGSNLRQDYGDINELSQSIVKRGLRMPLRGYLDKDKFIVIDGHRRLRAINLAIKNGHDFVSVDCINDPKSNEDTRLLDQLTCNTGKPFSSIEQADVIQKLVNLGWKQKDIAANLSKTQGFVSNMLKINGLPQKAKNLIIQGVMSASFALDVFEKCNCDESLFSQKLDVINEHHEATGEKVTKKKAEKTQIIAPEPEKTIEVESVVDIVQEEVASEPVATIELPEDCEDLQPAIPEDVKQDVVAEKTETKKKESNTKKVERVGEFEVDDYKLILSDAKQMIFELAQYVKANEQKKAASLIERIERYL